MVNLLWSLTNSSLPTHYLALCTTEGTNASLDELSSTLVLREERGYCQSGCQLWHHSIEGEAGEERPIMQASTSFASFFPIFPRPHLIPFDVELEASPIKMFLHAPALSPLF
jgi:hypothetical protein